MELHLAVSHPVDLLSALVPEQRRQPGPHRVDHLAHIDDIVASKKAANRRKDRESLPRLLSFRAWLKKEGKL